MNITFYTMPETANDDILQKVPFCTTIEQVMEQYDICSMYDEEDLLFVALIPRSLVDDESPVYGEGWQKYFAMLDTIAEYRAQGWTVTYAEWQDDGKLRVWCAKYAQFIREV